MSHMFNLSQELCLHRPQHMLHLRQHQCQRRQCQLEPLHRCLHRQNSYRQVMPSNRRQLSSNMDMHRPPQYAQRQQQSQQQAGSYDSWGNWQPSHHRPVWMTPRNNTEHLFKFDGE